MIPNSDNTFILERPHETVFYTVSVPQLRTMWSTTIHQQIQLCIFDHNKLKVLLTME